MNTRPASSIITSVRAGAELMRPANIVTAFADVMAGFAAAGGSLSLFSTLQPTPEGLGWLILSTFGLYGGGVVFNDVFDAKLDTIERPDRAIPSGRISILGASVLGSVLLIIGITSAFAVNTLAGLFAAGITILALTYDYWAKHSIFWGPLFMGACRAGNLLLGVCIIPMALESVWFLGIFPLLYIGAITLISQGEVHGGQQSTGFLGLSLVILVIVSLGTLSIWTGFKIMAALPFIILLAVLVVPAFYKAAVNPVASAIQKAVKQGVISLIILNSVIAAGFGGWMMGLVTALLLPISLCMSRVFKVT